MRESHRIQPRFGHPPDAPAPSAPPSLDVLQSWERNHLVDAVGRQGKMPATKKHRDGAYIYVFV